MRIKGTVTLFILLYINISAAGYPGPQAEKEAFKIDKIRQDFYMAVEDGDVLDDLRKYIKEAYQDDTENYPPVILAYYGALETLRAKHSYNPYNKFRYVIAGLKNLNSAVGKSPDALEVRFLRFAVLHNIPGVFGISDERNEDLKVVYEQLLKMDYSLIERDLQKGVVEFLLRSGRLDNIQTGNLKSMYPEAVITE